MKFTTFSSFNFFFVLLVSFIALVNALPVEIVTRDVFVPEILTPVEGEVWHIGESQLVTWNVSSPPAQITNPVGKILLRKGGLTTNLTLASNFSILAGSITVTVPNVTLDKDYAIVLFGDSGNFSPTFTIANSTDASS